MSRYDDIINLPHPEPKNHPRMPVAARAAQFAPFAALTGHGAAIAETARLTEKMTELSEERQHELSRKLNLAFERKAMVAITYFVSDSRKSGGRYIQTNGVIKKIDDIERTIALTNGRTIPLDNVTDIEGKILDAF